MYADLFQQQRQWDQNVLNWQQNYRQQNDKLTAEQQQFYKDLCDRQAAFKAKKSELLDEMDAAERALDKKMKSLRSATATTSSTARDSPTHAAEDPEASANEGYDSREWDEPSESETRPADD